MPEDTTLQLHIATLYITISWNSHNLSPTLPHHIYQIPTSYITYRISLHYHTMRNCTITQPHITIRHHITTTYDHITTSYHITTSSHYHNLWPHYHIISPHVMICDANYFAPPKPSSESGILTCFLLPFEMCVSMGAAAIGTRAFTATLR